MTDILNCQNNNKAQNGEKITGINPCKQAIVLISFTLLILFLTYFLSLDSSKIAKGTSLIIETDNPVDIGGLSLEEADQKIKTVINDYYNKSIQFCSSEGYIYVKLNDLNIRINEDKIMESVQKSLYSHNIIKSIVKHLNYNNMISLSNYLEMDKQKLNNFINSKLNFITKEPQDAKLYVNYDGMLHIQKEKSGCKIDEQKLYDNLLKALKENRFRIEIPEIIIAPKITESDIKSIMPTELISSYSSYYGGSDSGRKENVKLGASKINNILLNKGEEFEFWKYVGEPIASEGFKPAGVFLNGKLSVGIGGGLCQVSTTLYNAALLAGLKITERSPHSLPVSYVPLGLDAMVAKGAHTLKFINNTEGYLLIKSYADGNNITFEIYGLPVKGRTIKVYSKIINSKSADAYRDTIIDGKITDHEYLGRSRYR